MTHVDVMTKLKYAVIDFLGAMPNTNFHYELRLIITHFKLQMLQISKAIFGHKNPTVDLSAFYSYSRTTTMTGR